MRLVKVSQGKGLRRKIMLTVMPLISGLPVPDVIRTLMYRPEYFGKPYSAWLHEVMRGPSEWSVGERELFAAFTSRQNQCRFCIMGHSAASAQALADSELVAAALDDWQKAPVGPKLKAVLRLLERLTLEPERVTAEDIDLARAGGASDVAIAEAIQVCALFNIINRLADAFDFDTSLSSRPDLVAKAGQMLLKFGYRF
jgi:uncharacterized peroxidase-related enzyme